MFELKDTKALIRDVNPRAENHGDETALGVDIALQFSFSNKKLNLLQAGLLAALYQKEPNAESDDQQQLVMEDDLLPHLRFPLLGDLPWNYAGAGYTFEIDPDSLFGGGELKLYDCKVNNFRIECEEGGTIKLRCRVQSNPDAEMVGRLCDFLKAEVKVSLTPPQADDEDDGQGDIEDEAA